MDKGPKRRDHTDKALTKLKRGDIEQRNFIYQETGPKDWLAVASPLGCSPPAPFCPSPQFLFFLFEKGGKGRAYKPDMFPPTKAPWRS